jgi:hypothetical protein
VATSVRDACAQARLGWYRDGSRKWAYDGLVDHQREVFCQQRGDTDGPAENQEPQVSQLRGPYCGKRRAAHVANTHYRAHQTDVLINDLAARLFSVNRDLLWQTSTYALFLVGH